MKTSIFFILFLSGILAIYAIPFGEHSVNHLSKSEKISKNKVELFLEDVKTDVNNSVYCPICEYLINQGEAFITKKTTKRQAFDFLDHLCDSLPSSKHEICNNFVDENYQNIIEFIMDKESAQVVCSQLHYCNHIENEISECDFCKYAVHNIESFLHYNNTLNDIIEYGAMFCNGIKKRYIQQCNYVIPVYYSMIVGKLVDHHNFVNTCESLHLCM